MKTYILLLCLLVSSAVFAQEYQLISPIKSGRIVRGCSFIDDLNGHAVIQSPATVLRTQDGGITWYRPFVGITSTSFGDIEMLSLDVIVACGSNGRIFRSDNGGDSWLQVDTPTNEWLYAVESVSETVVFAVGFNGVILKSIDASATWVNITPVNTSRLFDVEFVSESTGFACGWNGTIIKTTDGGDNWNLLDSEYEGALFNCHFPSENVGYACGWSQTILKTEDGGSTWTEQFSNGNNALNYIEFKDEQNGWAAGDWGGYYTTNNGGTTWISSELYAGYEMWCGQYLSDAATYIMGQGIMLKSTDGPNTYGLLQNGVPQAKYNGVYFLDDDHGYVVGSVGTTGQGSTQSGIIYTENGGQTWDVQQQGSSAGWWDVHFSDENVGRVIGGANVSKTTNGGDNWSGGSLSFNLTGIATWSINEDEAMIGGDGLFNSICKTSDGGFNWSCQDNTLAGDFFFVNDQLGFAITEAGTQNIFKTEDGGNTWNAIDTQLGGAQYSIHFIDEEKGWIGANSGNVLRTVDGGATWELSSAGTDVLGIHFYSESIGYCIGIQGDIHRSNDGGVTWEQIYYPEDPNFPIVREAHFTDNYAYLGCWRGDIYKYTTGCGSAQAAQAQLGGSFCAGLSQVLSWSALPESYTFDYSLPDGWSATQEGNSLLITPNENSGTVSLIATNNCGISATTDVEIVLESPPQPIEGIVGATESCPNTSLVLEIENAQEGVDYVWSNSLGLVMESQEDGTSIIVGTEDFEVAVYAQNACAVSDTVLAQIQISSLPEMPTQIEGVLEYCALDTLALSVAAPVDGNNYVWENSLGLAMTVGEASMAMLLETENLTVSVFAENECGQSASLTENIVVNALPEVSMSFENDTLCLIQTHEPDLQPDGGILTGLGANLNAIDAFFLNPNEPYEYVYTYSDSLGCSNSVSAILYFENCMGIDEKWSSDILVYPNPASEQLFFDGLEGNSRVLMTDASGKIVLDERLESARLDISRLSPGVYTLELLGESDYLKQIVIKK